MITSIVWFKTDLRLCDNETLVKAIANSDSIIPVYCLDNDQFKTTAYGLQKTGNFRTQFILEALRDLDQQLRAIGSGLLLLRGDTAHELSKIAQHYNVQKVYTKKEVAFEEKNKQAQVEKELWKHNCTLETCSTSTLYHADDLPFSITNIPDVFTIFRKKTEKETSIRPVFEAPKNITSPPIEPIKIPYLNNLGLNTIIKDARNIIHFQGGETKAYKRLQYYFTETNLVSSYKETRNGLIGSDYSSKFSPWLAQGCISPRTIYYELKKHENKFGANDSTYWLVFELVWRDFFRFMFKKYPNKFFLRQGIKIAPSEHSEHNDDVFEKWKSGSTGVDFIDANMRELKHTGFMSNRGRQNVASYLINDLKIDWRCGAAYFEQQLIDYDVCSNWGNWAYLAGVGNDPKDKRYFNIEKQAKDYDAQQVYRNLWRD